MLEEQMDDPDIAHYAILAFVVIDGKNLTSGGEWEAMKWTLKILERHGMLGYMHYYFTMKGDADILDVMKQYRDGYYKMPELEMRVGGTNIFESVEKYPAHAGVLSIVSQNPHFIASVANMGSQAMYVFELLKRYWEQNGKDFSAIPEELLTMVVWFDADGNPVTNVDLGKYGLSMPVIDPKPDKYYRGTYTVTFPHEQEGWLPLPFVQLQPPTVPPADPRHCEDCEVTTQDEATQDDTKQSRLWLALALGILACIGTAFYVLRKKGKAH